MGSAWVAPERGPTFPALRSSQLCAPRDFTGALGPQGVAQIKAQHSLDRADYSELLPHPSAQKHLDSAEFGSIDPKAEAREL